MIVGPDRHLGGLSSGGLGWTDTGDKSVIGGLAREFYHRVWRHYQEPSAWLKRAATVSWHHLWCGSWLGSDCIAEIAWSRWWINRHWRSASVVAAS